MGYRTEHHQVITGVYGTGCEVRLTTERRGDFREFNGHATLRIAVGPMHLQTYLTPADLRALAYAALEAALALDAIEQESVVLEVAS